MEDGAIGFRVKSGWAMAVLLASSGGGLRVVDRRRVQLADPNVPDSAQPYHVALELPKAAAARALERLLKSTKRFANRAIADLVKDCQSRGYKLRSAGIVVGSDADPAAIKNDHIRAHAEEGRLFRVVIEEPLRELGLNVTITPEKRLYEAASSLLGIEEARLKSEVTLLGKAVSGGWRAEEKAAALAAWMELEVSLG